MKTNDDPARKMQSFSFTPADMTRLEKWLAADRLMRIVMRKRKEKANKYWTIQEILSREG